MFSVSVCSSICSGTWGGRGGRYTVRPPPWYSASLMQKQYTHNKHRNSSKRTSYKTTKAQQKTVTMSTYNHSMEKSKKIDGKKSPLAIFDALKTKVKINIAKATEETPKPPSIPPPDVDSETRIVVDERVMLISAQDLYTLSTLGRGAFGVVDRMEHQPTGTIMAVKRIPFTLNSQEQKQSLRDMDVAMKASACPHTVTCYGALFWEGDIWIMMEEMDTSLDKFYEMVYKNNEHIPEEVIAKIASSVIKGLYFLQSEVKVMHGDVKPSNILINRNGDVKICDYGISGRLVDSVAITIAQRGSKLYMAPEKINPPDAGFLDVRTDVWSLGLTLIELATGDFPYPKFKDPFQQLKAVVMGEPPQLPTGKFSPEFEDLVNKCLTKSYKKRPKYKHLLKHPFIEKYEKSTVDISSYVTSILDKYTVNELDKA